MVVGLPRKRWTQPLHPNQSSKKKCNTQKGWGSLCLQTTHSASLSRMLAHSLPCQCLQGRCGSHLEDEEKWPSSFGLPRVTFVKWWRQVKISDFPSEPNRPSLPPKFHQWAQYSGLCVHTSRLCLCQRGTLRTPLSWRGPRILLTQKLPHKLSSSSRAALKGTLAFWFINMHKNDGKCNFIIIFYDAFNKQEKWE